MQAAPHPIVAAPRHQLVDFEGLMAGDGHRIDVSRLQSDLAYARGCVAVATGSTSAALRQAAERLRHLLPVNRARS